jgi:hypothetical protein
MASRANSRAISAAAIWKRSTGGSGCGCSSTSSEPDQVIPAVVITRQASGEIWVMIDKALVANGLLDVEAVMVAPGLKMNK